MKGKYWLLASGILLTFVTASDQKGIVGFLIVLITCFYWFLVGVMFERYPKSSGFTGFTTVTDLPTGDLRLVAPVGLDGGGSRRLELNIEDIVEMDDPISETAKFLENAGFDMNGEIIWWDDPDTKNRIFTQEVQ